MLAFAVAVVLLGGALPGDPCAEASPSCRAEAQAKILEWRTAALVCRAKLDEMKVPAVETPTVAVALTEERVVEEGPGFWSGVGLGAGGAAVVAAVLGLVLALR